MSEERRQYLRLKLRLPIEILRESAVVPLRGETCDISLGGCYFESLFPLEVGTPLEVRIRINDSTLIAVAVVATCDRQVGNGIRFTDMVPEDAEQLRLFLDTAERTDPAAIAILTNDAHESKSNSELRPWPGWPAEV
jgi:c-di-GMP-binding flagellar brake protein YcgR